MSEEHNGDIKDPIDSEDVKRIRRELGLSQQELADKLGVNINSVSRWETGKQKCYNRYARQLQKLLKDADNELNELSGRVKITFDLNNLVVKVNNRNKKIEAEKDIKEGKTIFSGINFIAIGNVNIETEKHDIED